MEANMEKNRSTNEKGADLQGASGRRGPHEKLLLALVVVNSVGLLGMVGYLTFGNRSHGPTSPPPAGEAASVAAEGTGQEGGESADVQAGQVRPLFDFPALVVNLNEPSGDRYLKVKADLEISSKSLANELSARKSQIQDLILGYLSNLRFSQTQGLQGKEEIRKGVMQLVNSHLKTGRVTGVYFTEFVVQ